MSDPRVRVWVLGLCTAVMFVALIGCSSASHKSDSAGAPQASKSADSTATSASAPSEAASAVGAPKADAKQSQSANAQASSSPAASPAASPVSSPAASGLAAGPETGRMLIYKANAVMEVKDYNETQTQVRDLVHLSGGYIVQFQDSNNGREIGGTFQIKVPASSFSGFLDGLEKIHELKGRSIQGQDVSEEYVDLEARLKAKQAVETRLLSFMEKATSSKDLVDFSNELGRVQQEIEQLKGRMRYLEQNVAFSTIELRIYQKDAVVQKQADDQDPAYERAADAWNGSLKGVGRFFTGLFVFAAAALPVLFVLALFVIPTLWITLRLSKRNIKPGPQPPAKPDRQTNNPTE